MEVKKIYYLYIHLVVFINKLFYAKKITIHNKDNNFYNIKDLINNNQDEELYLYFVDNTYDMTYIPLFSVALSIQTNTYFIGNPNGTIFDYNLSRKGTLQFNFSKGNGQKLTFENINFINFYDKNKNEGTYMIQVNANSDNYYVVFNNCLFQNNQNILALLITCNINTHDDPSVLFNNAKFM